MFKKLDGGYFVYAQAFLANSGIKIRGLKILLSEEEMEEISLNENFQV